MPVAAVALVLFALPAFAAEVPDPLPDPDGKPADMSQPVQVYILLGQSNMVGAGKITGDKEGALTYAVQEKGKYPYLVDDEGAWTVRNDVRYVRVMGSGTGAMRQFNNGDVANAKEVLAELDKYYPGAKGYEIAGFFFWQGDKDRYNAAHASRYEPQSQIPVSSSLDVALNVPCVTGVKYGSRDNK